MEIFFSRNGSSPRLDSGGSWFAKFRPADRNNSAPTKTEGAMGGMQELKSLSAGTRTLWRRRSCRRHAKKPVETGRTYPFAPKRSLRSVQYSVHYPYPRTEAEIVKGTT